MQFEEDEVRQGDEDPEFTDSASLAEDIDDAFIDDDMPLVDDDLPLSDEDEDEDGIGDISPDDL